MHESPFRKIEESLDARWTERAGWRIPALYKDIRAEHDAARRVAAVIDRSPAGRIKVTGADRLSLLHRLCTQDINRLVVPGRGAPAVFTSAKGRIVDLVGVYDRGDSALLLTGDGRAPRLVEWIRKYVLADDVALTDITAEGGAFRVTGPRAPEVLRSLGEVPDEALGPDRITGLSLSGVETTLIGEVAGPRPSFLLMADRPVVADLFDAAASVARMMGGGPAGEEARQVLRVEDGLPEAEADLTEEYNPWEARLDRAISLNKGCYIGQEVVARLDTYEKVSRRLVGLRMGKEAAVPPAGSRLLSGKTEVGGLTSSVRSLALDETIGLGYVRIAHSEPCAELQVAPPEGGGTIPAVVTALPVVP